MTVKDLIDTLVFHSQSRENVECDNCPMQNVPDVDCSDQCIYKIISIAAEHLQNNHKICPCCGSQLRVCTWREGIKYLGMIGCMNDDCILQWYSNEVVGHTREEVYSKLVHAHSNKLVQLCSSVTKGE